MTALQTYLQECRDRAEKATPAPWVNREPWCSENEHACWTGHGPIHFQKEDEEETSPATEAYEKALADADFIAASRTDIPKLIGIIEVMREALVEYSNFDLVSLDDGRIVLGKGLLDPDKLNLGKVAKEALAQAERIAGE